MASRCSFRSILPKTAALSLAPEESPYARCSGPGNESRYLQFFILFLSGWESYALRFGIYLYKRHNTMSYQSRIQIEDLKSPGILNVQGHLHTPAPEVCSPFHRQPFRPQNGLHGAVLVQNYPN